MLWYRLLQHGIDGMRSMLDSVFILPTITLPQRLWGRLFGDRGLVVRSLLALAPWVLVLVLVGFNHYTYLAQGRPELLPEQLFGQPRSHWAAVIRNERAQYFAGQRLWRNVGVAVILASDEAHPVIASAIMGELLWAFTLFVSCLLLGPLHLVALDPRLRSRLGTPFASITERITTAVHPMYRALARSRTWWYVGFGDSGLPVYVPMAKRNTWVLGGSDRKSNATPMMLALRSAVLAGRPVLLIDTMGSVALAEQLSDMAREAQRSKLFMRYSLADNPGTDTPYNAEIFLKIARTQAVVYLSMPLQTQEGTQWDRARGVLHDLMDSATRIASKNTLVVAIQDGAELPAEELAEVVRTEKLQVIIAQQRCDASSMAIAAQQNKHAAMLVLAPSRKQDANVLAQALGRAAPKGAALTADMVRALRRREGVLLQDGAVVHGHVSLDAMASKRGGAIAPAPIPDERDEIDVRDPLDP